MTPFGRCGSTAPRGLGRRALGSIGLPAVTLALAACGAGLTLRMELHEPAVVPVGVFPRVFVRGDGGIDSEILVQAIVADLAHARIDVTELAPGTSAASRLGRDDGAALVVDVSVVRSEVTETRHVTETAPMCAAGSPGCTGMPVQRFHDVTVLRAHVELTMRDGRTDQVFAHERFERHEDDLDMGASGRLMDRVQRAALALFHATRTARELPLMPLSSRAGSEALADARAGRIGEAVAALRGLAAHAEHEPISERAALFFDLGQVLRVAAQAGGVELEVEARAALDEAMHLRPDATVGAAIEGLEEENAARARMRAEEVAYHRNREVAPPDPPRAYD